MDLSIIIPLWNEGDNVEKLASELAQNFNGQEVTVYLLDNGSKDNTKKLIEKVVAETGNLFSSIYLNENLGYGGGVREGFNHISSEWVCWMPGDLQVKPAEVRHVWEYIKSNNVKQQVVKGIRVNREDSFYNFLVSKFYTYLGRIVLGIDTYDLNALPKFFHINFIKKLPVDMRRAFIFDAQMLYYARLDGYSVTEVPVNWYKRYRGVSSWSGKKLKTYLSCLIDVFRIRLEKNSFK